MGYFTTASKDYYNNVAEGLGQGIGSRVPLINVPVLAYTDDKGIFIKSKLLKI